MVDEEKQLRLKYICSLKLAHTECDSLTQPQMLTSPEIIGHAY